jgi:hypothetical protein
MNVKTRYLVTIGVFLCCLTADADAADDAVATASNSTVQFDQVLRYQPLDLSALLGRHFTEVAPGAIWEELPVPEEYKNPSIRYGVFSRANDLHDYMKDWKFLSEKYCVSNYSMFLMFFNRGFVFKVELRYIPDSFTGAINADDPRFCADETPIFEMLAKKLNGTVISRQGSRELVQYTSKFIMKLGTGERTTDLSWDLRGGLVHQISSEAALQTDKWYRITWT